MSIVDDYNKYLKNHICGVVNTRNWMVECGIISDGDFQLTDAVMHDFSKRLQSQFIPYANYFYGE